MDELNGRIVGGIHMPRPESIFLFGVLSVWLKYLCWVFGRCLV